MSSLGGGLAFGLGGDDIVNPPKSTSHVEVALAKLVEQYKSLPAISAFISIPAKQTQELDDVLTSFETLTDIDASQGAQLDEIGKKLGEPRAGFDDVPYKLHLKARALLNRSSGTVPEIVNLFQTLLPDATVTLKESFPAGILVSLGGVPLDLAVAPYFVTFLRAAKVGGVRAVLKWLNALPANTFTFAGGGGSGFNVGKFASARSR